MQLKALSISFAILSSLTYVALGAPQSSQLAARNLKDVNTAVKHIGPKIGQGNTGTVHDLKDTYHGHKAVVKVIAPGANGGHFHPLPGKEAHNAHQAGQLLGHGHDHKTDTHYLVMKHMGDSAEKHGVHPHDVSKLNNAANDRYAKDHGIRNKDQNGGNFVYHNKNGHTQAEVVDWAKAEHLGTHPTKAPMPVEHVHHTEHGRKKCPTCTVQ
ncbi:hypothetical protein B0H34DRAFT_680049 [Crassisporium funariophilum]|nr:hypothetical protein B0H34DRAFT_680049 [Crassisporium funariophilum]